jgi:hypothetical protein
MTEKNTIEHGVDDTVFDNIQETTTGQFRGNFPDVPTADGVDVEALSEQDDGDPLYVTLPVVPKVGTVSTNGLLYDDALLREIGDQINVKRPGANFGHLPEAERTTAFPKPDAIWVGAKRVGETLWGKAYIRPGAARDYIRTLRAVGGSISTSIYGRGQSVTVSEGVRRLTKFDLDTLDFAPPARAALGGGVVPVLTAEMANNDTKETIMEKSDFIAELTVDDVPDAVREQIIADAANVTETADRISELEQSITDRDSQIGDLTTAVAEYRDNAFNASLDARIAELFDWSVVGESAREKCDAFVRTFRSRVVSELNGERDNEVVETAITSVWDDLKPLAETVRDALAGPPAIVGEKVRKDGNELVDTPETRAAARAKFQFN